MRSPALARTRVSVRPRIRERRAGAAARRPIVGPPEGVGWSAVIGCDCVPYLPLPTASWTVYGAGPTCGPRGAGTACHKR